MNDKFDTVMQEIAVKHGVVLSKDDPILILQTMNDRLIEETRQAQAAMLTQFREEMEGISSQWKDDAKEKAEKVLNAALTGSKEILHKLLRDSHYECSQVMKGIISDSLTEFRDLVRKTRKYCWITLINLATMLTAFFCLFCSLYFK
ncbi:TPA: conjugal transfer protein TraM [Legionella pneumophila]|uniref:conjugal transfer protein TraM n=1 Tax=Legionella pneumophila TaxID=446 RepID=UPI0007879634|nr:conjugal transfer protein TraM [Legionella pneumophila]HAT1749723.1 conjugal transfer protein TraM [Legionella pneumophila]HAT1881556.1 conjugal transfer protein TraM [Legionella pneumophila]HAT2055199.1 conjugal transfer protein TraM [Legionella pneumophila]HAT2113464.1 conjugal transfer protein TraM [Legionella pneumophila]HAT8721365.1 conjugal transfer protein TraM [Legionella pneumophila]